MANSPADTSWEDTSQHAEGVRGIRFCTALRVDGTLNRPGFELTPRSWTNFEGLHEEVQNGVQARGRPELVGGRRWRKAAGSAMVGTRGEDPHLGKPISSGALTRCAPSAVRSVRSSGCRCWPSRTVYSFQAVRWRRSMTFAQPPLSAPLES
jgi:hypothetical protein